MTPKAFHALFGRIGARAKMPFPIHPHMLRHGCGYALANAGHDTRALQAWLGSATKTSSTPCVTLSWHRIGSRTSGDRAARLTRVEGKRIVIKAVTVRPNTAVTRSGPSLSDARLCCPAKKGMAADAGQDSRPPCSTTSSAAK
jgi:hypothetical protein